MIFIAWENLMGSLNIGTSLPAFERKFKYLYDRPGIPGYHDKVSHPIS